MQTDVLVPLVLSSDNGSFRDGSLQMLNLIPLFFFRELMSRLNKNKEFQCAFKMTFNICVVALFPIAAGENDGSSQSKCRFQLSAHYIFGPSFRTVCSTDGLSWTTVTPGTVTMTHHSCNLYVPLAAPQPSLHQTRPESVAHAQSAAQLPITLLRIFGFPEERRKFLLCRIKFF